MITRKSDKPPLTVDIETRSLLPLKDKGLKYVMSRYTTLTILSIATHGQVLSYSYYDSSTHDNLPVILDTLFGDDYITYAHNGIAFDFPFLESRYKNYIKDAVDTIALFAPYVNSRSLSLENIAQQFGRKKNEAGQDLIKKLCLPSFYVYIGDNETLESYLARRGVSSYEECFSRPTDKQAADFLQYCEDDTTELLELIKLIPHNPVTGLNRKVFAIDRKINSIGLRVDTDLCKRLIKEGDALTKRLVKASPLHMDDLSSTTKFTAYIKKTFGFELVCCRKEYLTDLLNLPDIPDEMKSLIETRLEVASRSNSKLKTILSNCIGDRVYNYLNKDGTHTLRFSSTKMQLHNLPGDNKKLAWSAYRDLMEGKPLTSPRQIQAATRLVFIPNKGFTFYICDYSGIEARIAAWLCDFQSKLQAFREGRDVYVETAAVIYGKPEDTIDDNERKVGKVAELGGQYQMGGGRYVSYAASWGVYVEEKQGQVIIEGYRDNNTPYAGERSGGEFMGIAKRSGGMWKDLNNALIDIATRAKTRIELYKCVLTLVDGDLHLTLPSGDVLFYRNIAMKMCRKDEVDDTKTEWATVSGEPFIITSKEQLKSAQVKAYRAEGYRPQVVYGYTQTSKIYGGKFLENICQAVGAALLKDALVKVHDNYLHTPLHVHDEIIFRVSKDEEKQKQQIELIHSIMSTPPPWAEGLPLDCEGFISPRFCKSPEKKKESS